MLQPMTFAQWKNLYDYRRESYIKQIKDKMDREMAKEDKATLAENSMPASRLILKQQSNTYGKKYYKEVRKPERKRRREARKIGAIKDHRVLNRPDSPDFGMDSLDFEDFEPAIKRKKLSARVLKELEELSAVDQYVDELLTSDNRELLDVHFLEPGQSGELATLNSKTTGHDVKDVSPSLVTTGVELLGSDPSDQEEVLVQEEPTPRDVAAGWTRIKLEPDW